ncbi:ROK family protein, partial [candidate division KSB1 bacterium]
KESELRTISSFDELRGKMLETAARNGDQVALEAFEYTGKMLGLKLADTIAHTSPEAIFLFGGLSQAQELIFNPTRHYMNQYLLPIFRDKVKLLPSGLQGADAAILGAAALVWKEL